MRNADLKNARNRAGFTQEQLAEQSNISLRQINRFESGERLPRVDTAIRIAELLGIKKVSDLKALFKKSS